MRVGFLGTAEFSLDVLKGLYQTKYKPILVVTGEDKKANRGRKIKFSPIKEFALEKDLLLYQSNNVSDPDFIKSIKALKPDVIITASFGQILTQEFLDIAKVLNVHTSLLPKYRGSSPIQQAILNGDTKTGITIMETVLELDAGDIALQQEVKILENETAGELEKRLGILSGNVITKALDLIEKKKYKPYEQDHKLATYTKKINKKDGKINLNLKERDFLNHARAMHPWPCLYADLNGKNLKIHEIKATSNDFNETIGALVVDKKSLYLKLNGYSVEVLKIQPEGKKVQTATDFINGFMSKCNNTLILK